MKRFLLRTLLLPLFLTLFPVLSLSAQPAPSDTTFVSLVRGTELAMGAILQADGAVGTGPMTSGFDVPLARLRFQGKARSARFFIQTDILRSPAVVDARLRLPITQSVSITAGQYKAPFSREYLLSSASLPFLERSRVVNGLAPKRQVGVSMRASLAASRLHLEGGVFNGNGTSGLNDNDALLYVGRLSSSLPLAGGALRLGMGAGYSRDHSITLPLFGGGFTGRRLLLGADVALQWQGWMLAGEWLTASYDVTGGRAYRPSGYHVTTGYRLATRHQLLLRVDGFHPDGLNSLSPGEHVLIGYNLFWTRALKFQANYEAPTGDLSRGRAGFRLQVALK